MDEKEIQAFIEEQKLINVTLLAVIKQMSEIILDLDSRVQKLEAEDVATSLKKLKKNEFLC